MIRIQINEARYLEIKPVKKSAEPHSTGQGTDIHITKIAPGSEFGQGYMVEIFDYGQKVDETFAQTKKQVTEIIKEQKARYNTNKAFEEELKLHVTYKSPGGQGFKHSGSNKEVEVMDIDQILYSKAAKINNLIASLEDPTISRKDKRALDPMTQSTSFAPQPTLSIDDSGVEISSQDELVEYLKNQLVEYFSDPSTLTPEPEMGANSNVLPKAASSKDKKAYAPGENPENIVSKYLADIRHIIERDDPNGEIFDLNQAAESLKSIFKDSGLPGEGVLFKAASFGEDILVSKVNTDKDNSLSLKNTLENTDDIESKIENISKRPDKNEAELLLSKLNTAQYLNDLEEMFRYASDDFWKYLQEYKGINTLTNVYSNWQKKVNPLIINEELNPLLRSYILSNIEGYIKHSKKEEIHRQAFDSTISSYRTATTIIINENGSDEERIFKTTEGLSEDTNNSSKEPEKDTKSENVENSASATPSPENTTLLDTLKPED